MRSRMAQRQSNIELLRILAMFMIVVGHAATNGHDIPSLPLDSHSIFAVSMSQGARIAVDIFVIITGAFGSKCCNFSKLGSLYRQIWFYSVSILLATILFTDDIVATPVFIKSIFPIYTSQYWFATDYIILIILSPLLNRLISSLDKRAHGMLLFCAIIVLSLLPSIVPVNPSFFNMLIWFIVLYFIGAYLRLYDIKIFNRIKYWHGLLILFGIMCSAAVIYYLGYEYIYFRHNTIYLLAEPNKITALVCALSLFIGFRNINIGSIWWINTISVSTFAVYLISDHPLIRSHIYRPIADNIGSQFYPAIYVVWCAIIFVLCIAIEKLRKKFDDFIFNKHRFRPLSSNRVGGGK